MTDKEIIQLAEKTRKEKYCDKYHIIISGCNSECPFSNGYDYGCNVAHSEYQQSFLDGFKAALNEICKDVDKYVCKITFQDTGKND